MNYSELEPLPIGNNHLQLLCHRNGTNPHTQELISLKETILDILNKNEEITFDDEEYKNPEIDSVITKITELTPNFQKLQDELSEIDKEYKKEIKEVQTKITMIESMITFLNQISYSNIDKKDLQDIIDKMKTVSEGVLKNESITSTKKKYAEKRKELYPHLHLMRQLNQWNVANMCPICFRGQVTHYLNPCGHTGCKECLERNRKERDSSNTMPQSEPSFECAFCRDQIMSIKPLYFL